MRVRSVHSPLMVDGPIETALDLRGVMRDVEPSEHSGLVDEFSVGHFLPVIVQATSPSARAREKSLQICDRLRRGYVAEPAKDDGPGHVGLLVVLGCGPGKGDGLIEGMVERIVDPFRRTVVGIAAARMQSHSNAIPCGGRSKSGIWLSRPCHS